MQFEVRYYRMLQGLQCSSGTDRYSAQASKSKEQKINSLEFNFKKIKNKYRRRGGGERNDGFYCDTHTKSDA